MNRNPLLSASGGAPAPAGGSLTSGTKRRSTGIFVLTLLAGLILCPACSTASRSEPRPLSVAVAITPVGATLSAEQIARVHGALKPELQRVGYTFAESSAAADLVLLVTFSPIAGGTGGRLKIIGLEPTAEFRRATDGADTPEAKEMRRRQREIEQWVERQSSSSGS
jgi:hypothetical protein